jgi:hypothetical protein
MANVCFCAVTQRKWVLLVRNKTIEIKQNNIPNSISLLWQSLWLTYYSVWFQSIYYALIEPTFVGWRHKTLQFTCTRGCIIWQEVLGRTNRPFSLIRHRPHWKRRVQQFCYYCMRIRYRGNVSTEPLPSNDRGIHIQTHRLMRGISSLLSLFFN